MIQIIATTDGRFIGKIIDINESIILDGFIFVPDKIQNVDGLYRLSNSSYVIDAKEIE